MCLCFRVVDPSAFVHGWGKGNMADVRKDKRKDNTTYAVVLYTGDNCVKHCPPGP